MPCKKFTNFSYCFRLVVLLSLSTLVCSSKVSNTECLPWFFHNATTNRCQCYHNEHLDRDIHCREAGVYIGLGNCITYESSVGTFFAKCFYFQLPHSSVIASTYLLFREMYLSSMTSCVGQCTEREESAVNVLMVLYFNVIVWVQVYKMLQLVERAIAVCISGVWAHNHFLFFSSHFSNQLDLGSNDLLYII